MFASRKRARDDEEDDIQDYAHVNKQRTLPFRTSPTSKYGRGFSHVSRMKPAPLFTQTVTPADSSEEETSPPFTSSLSRTQPSAQLAQLSTTTQRDIFEHNYDMDMDMDAASSQGVSPCHWTEDTTMSSPKTPACTFASSQLTFRDPFQNTQMSTTGSRLPTPIYGHFQQSIEAKMELGEDPENMIHPVQQRIEYEKYVHRRRLPTPIDEDEDMDPSALGRLAMDTEHESGQQTPSKTSHAFAPPPRSTRLSFSMGVRADCELCRMKVPGHSNHIFKA